MKPIFKKLSTVLLISLVFVLSTASALAGVGLSDTSFKETGFGYAPELGGRTNIGDKIETAEESFGRIMEYFTGILFMFAGAVAMYFIIMAGFKLMTARGEEEAVTKAHQMLLWSILGFLLVILAYTLVVNIGNLVFQSLGG
jgi:hypothetical protein